MIAIAYLLAIPAIVLALLFLSFVLSWPFYYAWNYVIPEAFHGPHLTWLQAFALSIVSSTLFKSSSFSKGE